MAKFPDEKNVLNFSRQVRTFAMDGKQVASKAMFEGVQVSGNSPDYLSRPLPGAGKEVPSNSLPARFTSPVAPKIPSKK